MDEILKEKNGVLLVYLTPLIGPFDGIFFSKMRNVVDVRIPGCNKVDPNTFVDAIVEAKQIEEVDITGCKQFNEYQLVRMFKSLPNLVQVFALETTGILSVSAYEIVTNARKIRVLKVVPKFPIVDKKNWSQLHCIFLHIDFGEKVKAIISDEDEN